MGKKSNISLKFFIINDAIILLLNITILVFLSMLVSKEYSFRKTIKLFLFQLIESGLIICLNIVMEVKMFLSNFKGHNNYGMFIRFLLFYLNLSATLLASQRSDNINQDDILKLGNILLYIGLGNNAFIITSMILSFIVVDTKAISSKLNKEELLKEFNINSVENMELFESDKGSSKQGMTELAQK